ncbi:MAG: hypothetical protein ACYTFG_13700, partial [Planctomycetota bacterium]
MKNWTASVWIRWITVIVAATWIFTLILAARGNRSPGPVLRATESLRMTSTRERPGTFLLLNHHPLPPPTDRQIQDTRF